MIVGALEIQMMTDLARLRKDMATAKTVTSDTARKINSTFAALRGMVGAISAGAIVTQLIQMADSVQLMDARLRIATQGEANYAKAKKAVYDISQRNMVALETTNMLYARLDPVIRRLGGSTEYTAGVTEAVATALRVSGASTQEASSTMIQFSQAMALGVLRGEEFNSVSENGSRILTALENQLGKSRGELRKMAADGKLTADVVGNALVKELAALRKEASIMPVTVSGAFQRIKNDLTVLVGELNKGTGATRYLTGAMELFRSNMVLVASALGAAFKIAVAYFAIFKGGPAIIALYTAAKLFLIKTTAAYSAAAAIAGTRTIWLTAMFGTATTASFSLAAGVTALQAAFAALFAFIIGWQIGQWLRDNFLEVRLGGIAMVNGLLKSFAGLQYGILTAWAYIREGWDSTLESLGDGMAWLLRLVGDGLGALGLDTASAKMLEWANSMDGATRETYDLAGETARLKAEYDATVKAVDEITGEMADYEISSHASKKATGENKDAISLLSDTNVKAAATAAELARKEKERVAALVAAAELQNQMAEEAIDRDEALRQANEEQIRTARTYLEQLEYETAALQMTNEERAVSTAMRDLERQGIVAGTQAYDAYIERVRAAVLKKTDVEESIDAAKKQAQELENLNNQIGQSLADALMDGGKSAWEYIKGLFRSQVLSPVIQAIMQPLTSGISSVLSSVTGAITGGAGGGGGIMGSISSLAGLTGAGSMFGAGLTAGIGNLFGGTAMSALGASGTLIGGGSVAAGLGMAAGVLGPLALAVGVLGPALFGRKLKDYGIEGTLNTEGISGQGYKFYKGGLFRSNKTKRGPLDPGVEQAIDSGITAAAATVRSYVDLLGLPAKAMEFYNEQIKVSFKGLSEEEIKAEITDIIARVQAGLAAQYTSVLDFYAREGETALQTLERLSAIQAFTESINEFGGVFSSISRLSIDARENLLAMSGGIEALLQKSQQFVTSYYTEQEQAAISARAVLQSLTASGVDIAGVDTLAEYRALVEGRDLTTELGREQFTALLNASESFAALAKYLQENSLTLDALATLAPAIADIGALFDVTEADVLADPVVLGLDSVSTTIADTNAAVVAAIEQLRLDVQNGLSTVAINTAKTSTLLDSWDDNGSLTINTSGDNAGA